MAISMKYFFIKLIDYNEMRVEFISLLTIEALNEDIFVIIVIIYEELFDVFDRLYVFFFFFIISYRLCQIES